MSPAYLSQPA